MHRYAVLQLPSIVTELFDIRNRMLNLIPTVFEFHSVKAIFATETPVLEFKAVKRADYGVPSCRQKIASSQLTNGICFKFVCYLNNEPSARYNFGAQTSCLHFSRRREFDPVRTMNCAVLFLLL